MKVILVLTSTQVQPVDSTFYALQSFLVYVLRHLITLIFPKPQSKRNQSNTSFTSQPQQNPDTDTTHQRLQREQPLNLSSLLPLFHTSLRQCFEAGAPTVLVRHLVQVLALLCSKLTRECNEQLLEIIHLCDTFRALMRDYLITDYRLLRVFLMFLVTFGGDELRICEEILSVALQQQYARELTNVCSLRHSSLLFSPPGFFFSLLLPSTPSLIII